MLNSYDKEHIQRIEKNAKKIEELYRSLINKITGLSSLVDIDADNFNISDYPALKKEFDKMFEVLAKDTINHIQSGVRQSWFLAEAKNDALVDLIANRSKFSREQIEKYKQHNRVALNAFLNRKEEGMKLSDRVWKYTEHFKNEIEMGLSIGIAEGKSAAELARELRANLKDPNRLFRKVRDNEGKLKLSQPAEAYNPGRGVYRSSVKNAQRLARTEINIAYHEANYEKYQQFDFVIGQEIKVSNNLSKHCPFCVAMQGKYPKDFKFKGWHPQCMCSSQPILKSWDEIDVDTKAIREVREIPTSKNEITDVPQQMKDWIAANEDKIDAARVKPYFVGENARHLGITIRIDDKMLSQLKERGYRKLPPSDSNFNNLNLLKIDDAIQTLANGVGAKIDIKEITYNTNYITVSAKSRDESFYVIRNFINNSGIKTVSHQKLKIPENAQKSGYGKRFFRSMFREYQAFGVEKITLVASDKVGGYAWARYGFKADDGNTILGIADKAKGLSKSEKKKFDAWFNRSIKENDFDMRKLSDLSFGKKLLLGSDWRGFLDFNNKKQMRVFLDYLYH